MQTKILAEKKRENLYILDYQSSFMIESNIKKDPTVYHKILNFINTISHYGFITSVFFNSEGTFCINLFNFTNNTIYLDKECILGYLEVE